MVVVAPFSKECIGVAIATDTSGKHILKVEIPPVPGEQNTEDNIKTVTIEAEEPAK